MAYFSARCTSHLIALATGCQGNEKKKDKFYRTLIQKSILRCRARVGSFRKLLQMNSHLLSITVHYRDVTACVSTNQSCKMYNVFILFK